MGNSYIDYINLVLDTYRDVSEGSPFAVIDRRTCLTPHGPDWALSRLSCRIGSGCQFFKRKKKCFERYSGWEPGVWDKHLMWLQCIKGEFHSLNFSFKLSCLSLLSKLISFSFEAWALAARSHFQSIIMNSARQRKAGRMWQQEAEGMLVIWSVDNKRKLPVTDLITSVYQAVFKSLILHNIYIYKKRAVK